MLLKRKLLSKIIITISIFINSANIVQAALIQGTMHGVIAGNAETRGDGVNVFGQSGDNLLNQSFVVNFYYHTDTAPVTGSFIGDDDSRTFYGSSDAGLDWLGLSITINDFTYNINGTNRYADILDNTVTGDDKFQLAIERNSGPFDGISFRREYLDIALYLETDVLNQTSLPTTLSSTAIIDYPPFNSASFKINDFDVNQETGDLLYERYVNLYLDIDSIETTIVPLPASIWLFASGLLGIFIKARKKAQ